MSEIDRINFIVERDGALAAAKFVRQTIKIYRRAVLNTKGFAPLPEYRAKFIKSYCELKKWIREYDATHTTEDKLIFIHFNGYGVYTVPNGYVVADPSDDAEGFSIEGSDLDEVANEAYEYIYNTHD